MWQWLYLRDRITLEKPFRFKKPDISHRFHIIDNEYTMQKPIVSDMCEELAATTIAIGFSNERIRHVKFC